LIVFTHNQHKLYFPFSVLVNVIGVTFCSHITESKLLSNAGTGLGLRKQEMELADIKPPLEADYG